nr:hypothetical protein [Mycobacterium sp. UM_NZ2]
MTSTAPASAADIELWSYPVSDDPADARLLGSIAQDDIANEDWPICGTCEPLRAYISLRANNVVARQVHAATLVKDSRIYIFRGHHIGHWYWSGRLSEWKIERATRREDNLLTMSFLGSVKASAASRCIRGEQRCAS